MKKIIIFFLLTLVYSPLLFGQTLTIQNGDTDTKDANDLSVFYPGGVEFGAGGGGFLTITNLNPIKETYGGSIFLQSGSFGAVTINASGESISLTGALSYNGGTTLAAGTLNGNISPDSSFILSSSSLPPSPPPPAPVYNLTENQTAQSLAGDSNAIINLGNNTLTINNTSGQLGTTFNGNITGTGGLILSNGANLTLGGTNTYTGGTTINQSTLRGTLASLPSQGTFQMNGGTLSLSNPSTGTFFPFLTGSGTLQIAGGNIVVPEATGFTGGIQIDGGASFTFDTPIPANGISIAANGNLAFDSGTTVASYGGPISGSGAVTVLGPTLLTLSGANSYSGGTTIAADGSTLTGSTTSLQGDIVNNNTVPGATGLTFNQSTAGTYAGAISGAGGVEISGGGTVTFTGANTYTGFTGIASDGSQLIGSTSTLPQGGTIFNNSILTFNQTSSGIFTGNISEAGVAGQVFVEGNGVPFTLTLAGMNTYTGVTTVNSPGATLQGSIPGSQLNLAVAGTTYDLGTADQTIGSFTGVAGSIVNLETSTLTAGGDGTSTTFNGTIVDAGAATGGSFVKNGTGTLTLTTAPTYGGSTTINEGTLQVSSGTLPQGPLFLNGGTLPLAVSQNFITLSGTGGSINLGSSTPYTLNILGDNSTTQYNFGGNMTGAGLFILGSSSSTGTLSLTGSNSYTGGTIINSGSTLIAAAGSLPPNGTITNNGTLTYNQPQNGVFSGSINGTGDVQVLGAAAVTFLGVQPYSGDTHIGNNSTLIVNGRIPNSSVRVDEGGTLGGTGTIHFLDLAGTLSPGNSIGSITIITDHNSRPSAMHRIEVSSDGTSDQVLVTRRAHLDGSLNVVSMENRQDLKNKEFTFLTAANGIDGQFSTLVSDSRIKYLVHYDLTAALPAVRIVVQPWQNFADAFSPNDESNPARAARYFDTFADNTVRGSDLNNIINLLDGLLLVQDGTALTSAFNQIQPSLYGELGGLSFLHSELVNRTVSSQQQFLKESYWMDIELRNQKEVTATVSPLRLAAFRNLVDDRLLRGFNASQVMTKPQTRSRFSFLALPGAERIGLPGSQRIRLGKSSVWFQPYGQVEETRANHGNPGIRSQTGGFSLGGDHEIMKNTYAGILGGFSTTPFDWGRGRGKGRMKSYYGGVYGTWLGEGGLYADGQIIAGQNTFHTQRKIGFSGIQRVAKGHHHAGQFAADLQLGYAMSLKPVTLQPYADVTYAFTHEKGFREHGAQSLNFKMNGRTSQFFRGELGAQAYRTFVFGDALVRPALQLSWVHKRPVGSHTSRVKGTLVGQSQTLTVLGDNRVRNQIAPGVGLTIQFAKGLYIIANVTSQMGSGQKLGDALLRVGYDF